MTAPPPNPAPPLHALLRRQLARLGLPEVPAQPWPPELASQLLQRVSQAYAQADQQRYLLERSQDVSSREMTQLHDDLRTSQARLASLVSLSSDWVWEQDAALRFTYVSDDALRSGSPAQALLGQRRQVDALPPVPGNNPAEHMALVAARQPFRNFTYGVQRPDGQVMYIRISGEPVFDGQTFKGYRGVASDVTEATLAEQQVQQLARFDSLTGLANRSMFLQELERTLSDAQRHGKAFAVLFVDLDRFKTVNDTLGHDAGDALLKVMARRLNQLLRGVDLVARLGGDEFVLMVQGCTTPTDLSKLASRILTALCEPMHLGSRTVQMTASIGISLYPADGTDSASLLKCADTAMYLAKARGKNNFQFFTPDLAQRAARYFALENELRQALDLGELSLYYQPQFRAANGELCGMEALVRWRHPQRGLLNAGEFVPLAEESGLIVPIGRWVVQEACRQIRRWREDGHLPPRCSVNLSSHQLNDQTIVDEVRHALQQSGLEAGVLELELTESMLAADPEQAQAQVQQLNQMGVHIAIDDFGTGYSSLSYLKHFPAQTLKLDRSFIAGLPANADDTAITQAVITLAHSLDMAVVAEGVETDDQRRFLAGLGCDKLQGYLLGRPMSGELMRLLLPQRTDRRHRA